ncbi:MAG TPA: AAA family ATPase, partial [Candidatus Binatus sp.]|nr:AAA family ATPase [Candidatus Binatus sp.]
MKLLSLYANNFKKLKLKQSLPFTEGIVLITGLNESGKSTILDAILYALFGRMIRPSQKPGNDDIISYGASDCQVRLEFAIGSTKYRVTRELHRTRPGRALLQEIRPGGTPRNLATSFSDTTEEVERLLAGITYNEIVASNVVAQKDLERLIKQRLDDRRKVINIFLNLESFNKVQDQLESDRASIEGTNRNPGRLTLEQRELEKLEEELKLFKDSVSQLETLESRIKASKADLVEFEKQYQETDGLFKTLNAYDEVSHRISSIETEIQDKSRLAENLSGQIEQFESHKRELETAHEQIRDYAGLSNIKAELEKVGSLVDTTKEFRMNREQILGNITTQEANILEKRKEQETGIPIQSQLERYPSHNQSWTYLILTAGFGAASILTFLLTQLIWATVALGSLAIVFLLLHAKHIGSLPQSQTLTVSKEEQERLTSRELVKIMEDDLLRLRAELASIEDRQTRISSEAMNLLTSTPRYGKSLLNNVTDLERAYQIINSAYEKDSQQETAIEGKIMTMEGLVKSGSDLQPRLTHAQDELLSVKEKLRTLQLPSLPQSITFSDDLLKDTEDARDKLRDKLSRVRTQIEEAQTRQREIKHF